MYMLRSDENNVILHINHTIKNLKTGRPPLQKLTDESQHLTTSIVQPDVKEKISLILKKESSHDSNGNSKMT